MKLITKLKKWLPLFVFPVLMVTCKKETLPEVKPGDLPGLGGDKWPPTAIDKWLHDSLVIPYNIGVKYKWDQFEFDISRTLVPPDESKVIPVWRMIKDVWINPYIAEAGLTFFNKFSPKNFVLSGSVSYNDNSSVILGTAEGGRKIVLYAVNSFKTKGTPGYNPASDSNFVKQWFVNVIHHEFTHILNQTLLYPEAFKRVNPILFQGNNWTNVSNNDANRDGFITAYGSSSVDEDFAEMVAQMLVAGKAGFDNLVTNIPPGSSANGTPQATAQGYLRTKEAIVVAYFKQAFGIDFYALQARCRTALNKYL